MGVLNKFKDFMGISEEYEEEDYDQQDIDILTKKSKKNNHDVSFDEIGNKRNKVVNINATAQLQVVLVKPERFEDASSVADHLNERRTVVLNLEFANKDISRRLVDFLSGVAYANNGQIKRVANSIFIITPYNVGLMGDLLDELESSGVSFDF